MTTWQTITVGLLGFMGGMTLVKNPVMGLLFIAVAFALEFMYKGYG